MKTVSDEIYASLLESSCIFDDHVAVNPDYLASHRHLIGISQAYHRHLIGISQASTEALKKIVITIAAEMCPRKSLNEVSEVFWFLALSLAANQVISHFSKIVSNFRSFQLAITGDYYFHQAPHGFRDPLTIVLEVISCCLLTSNCSVQVAIVREKLLKDLFHTFLKVDILCFLF